MGDIFVVPADGRIDDPDGGTETNLTNTPQYDECCASWSPDGRRIVFERSPVYVGPLIVSIGATRDALNSDIYIMDADGGNVTPLIVEPHDQVEPDWSPDGKWIAFGEVMHEAVGIVRPNGSGRTRLLGAIESGYISGPDWSPDGKKFLFTVMGDLGSSTGIWVMNADGTEQRKLTQGSDYAPTWSPDGEKIVFSSVRDGPWQVFTMDDDGSNVTKLLNLAFLASSAPDWGPRSP